MLRTFARLFMPPASSIALVAVATDCRTGSRDNRAYIIVASALLCPSDLPMIASDAPLIACQLPSERRKSWIRKSVTSARFSKARQRFFGGVMYPAFEGAG